MLVAADVARGTGRFNVILGLFAAAQGLGANASNVLVGFLAARFGFAATFDVLAGLAALALAVFLVAMPETRPVGADTNARTQGGWCSAYGAFCSWKRVALA